MNEPNCCPDCHGHGTVYTSPHGETICEGCSGCGELARCDSCSERIPANQDYDLCGACAGELEVADASVAYGAP